MSKTTNISPGECSEKSQTWEVYLIGKYGPSLVVDGSLEDCKNVVSVMTHLPLYMKRKVLEISPKNKMSNITERNKMAGIRAMIASKRSHLKGLAEQRKAIDDLLKKVEVEIDKLWEEYDQVSQESEGILIEFLNQKKELRPLTSMTPHEMRIIFNDTFSDDYCKKMIDSFGSLYGFFTVLGNYANFDTYRVLVEKGFDVEFTLTGIEHLQHKK